MATRRRTPAGQRARDWLRLQIELNDASAAWHRARKAHRPDPVAIRETQSEMDRIQALMRELKPRARRWPTGHGEPEPGLTQCSCRDCEDTSQSADVNEPELCDDCFEAGCTPNNGVCLRPGVYAPRTRYW